MRKKSLNTQNNWDKERKRVLKLYFKAQYPGGELRKVSEASKVCALPNSHAPKPYQEPQHQTPHQKAHHPVRLFAERPCKLRPRPACRALLVKHKSLRRPSRGLRNQDPSLPLHPLRLVECAESHIHGQ